MIDDFDEYIQLSKSLKASVGGQETGFGGQKKWSDRKLIPERQKKYLQ